VPSLPTPSLLPVATASTKTKAATAKANPAGSKLHRKAPPPNHSFMHNLSVFPKRFNDFLKKYI
jgi:hypothetical protein